LSLVELAKLPYGLIVALSSLRRDRPDAVISFGGYLGATTSLAAYLLRIPVFLHEQTVVAGKANRLIGLLAKRIYLTWESSRSYFPEHKTIQVGLPLRQSILSPEIKKIFARRRPSILVMGGKQGAHALNRFVFTHLKDLLKDYNVIHQTGTNSATADYECATSLKNTLGSLSDCYLPLGYIAEPDLGTYLASVDYYFGRSGAHITYELLVLNKKAILVPLKHTHQQEQFKNARELVRRDLGVIVPQSELTLRAFYSAVQLLSRRQSIKAKLPTDATKKIYDDITSFL
jgi:UDP-N-acetylglucosamine--N-acetylmuramyl-(pentapeptide) pyrophosphoryl-undecaprenol N-acetylglucosamine transferase